MEELIRPAGYFRVKAKRLRSLLEFLVERYDGSLEAMFRTRPARRCARNCWRSRRRAARRPTRSCSTPAGCPSFVVDAYTHRIFARHGWIGFDADYRADPGYFQGELAGRTRRCTTSFTPCWSALGKDYCRKAQPRCEECPLRELLPAGGPLEED